MTLTTQSTDTIRRVRNVSETVISAMSTTDTLQMLLTHFDAEIGFTEQQDRYGNMAGRLSKIARKDPPWGWRYVQSVASGTVEPSRKFSRAVEILAVTIDSVPVPIAQSFPVTVYAEAGAVREGALVMGQSRICASPACSIVFVPNVPWRRKCPVCSPVSK